MAFRRKSSNYGRIIDYVRGGVLSFMTEKYATFETLINKQFLAMVPMH